ncbi:MAG: hypothetical protein IT288_17805 [Bdellovibrionales bacterium]|nr:hypothetical protein [Bdellovibrionales bacterium]
MSKSLLGLVLLVGAIVSQTSKAESYTVRLTKQVTESESTYLRTTPQASELELSSSRQVTNTYVEGEGPLAQLNQSKLGEVDEAVIGLDIKGHSRLSLVNDNNQIYVVMSILIDDVVSGVPINLPVQMSIPAQFRRGSWEDYQAGREVELEYTEQGRETAHEAIVAKTKYLMRVVSKALKQQLPDAAISDVRVDQMQIDGEGKIVGTRDRLRVTGAQVTIQVSFDIEM